jgi:hypothetical protein
MVQDPGGVAVSDETIRGRVLRDAESLIVGDRNITYGHPMGTFTDIGAVWSVYLRHKLQPGVEVDAADVGWLMLLLKAMRDRPVRKRDNAVDAAGYAGCLWECVEALDD